MGVCCIGAGNLVSQSKSQSNTPSTMAVAKDGAPFYGCYNMLEEAPPSLYSSALYSPPLSSSGSSYPQPDEPHHHSPNKTTTTNSFLGGSFLSFQTQDCFSFGQQDTQWDQDRRHQNMFLDDAGGSDWLYGDGPAKHQSPPPALQQTSKRPLMAEENMQTVMKKQCTRKPKPSKSAKDDPQSIAAKKRRERVSERLKILQDIVPNGSKVDLVSMLEKAISYVKFLQLQVKVLATDEFWPASGGRLPNITQVREAIDAILSTRTNDHKYNNHPTPTNERGDGGNY